MSCSWRGDSTGRSGQPSLPAVGQPEGCWACGGAPTSQQGASYSHRPPAAPPGRADQMEHPFPEVYGAGHRALACTGKSPNCPGPAALSPAGSSEAHSLRVTAAPPGQCGHPSLSPALALFLHSEPSGLLCSPAWNLQSPPRCRPSPASSLRARPWSPPPHSCSYSSFRLECPSPGPPRPPFRQRTVRPPPPPQRPSAVTTLESS